MASFFIVKITDTFLNAKFHTTTKTKKEAKIKISFHFEDESVSKLMGRKTYSKNAEHL